MTKDMSVRQAMHLAESDRIHEGAELHDLPMCRAMIVMHDEIERLQFILDGAAPAGWIDAMQAKWETRSQSEPETPK